MSATDAGPWAVSEGDVEDEIERGVLSDTDTLTGPTPHKTNYKYFKPIAAGRHIHTMLSLTGCSQELLNVCMKIRYHGSQSEKHAASTCRPVRLPVKQALTQGDWSGDWWWWECGRGVSTTL